MKKTTLAVFVAFSLCGLSACGDSNVDPESVLSKGYKALDDDNYRAANIEFKALLEKMPENDKARLGLAKVAFELRDFDGALIELDKISTPSSDIIEDVEILRARALHRSSAQTALIERFEGKGVFKTQAYIDELTYYLAVSKWTQNDASMVKDALANVSKDSPFYPLITTVEALSREALDEIEVKTPEISGNNIVDSESSLLMSNIALSTGNMKEAISSLWLYHTLNPNDNQRTLQYVHLLVEDNQYTLAKDALTPLLKAFPRHALISELNARILYQEQDYEGALSASTVAVVSNPDAVIPRLIAAYSSAKLERPKEALDNLEFVINKLPDTHPAQRLYVRLKASEGKFDGLAEKVLAFDDVQDGDAELLSSLGLEMLRQGDKGVAEKLASKAESLGESTSNLGLLQLSLSDQEGALKTLEDALMKDPTSAMAGNSLATAYLVSKEFDKADALADEWISEGKGIEGLMLKGVVASRQDKMKEAHKYFDAVLEKEPEHFMAKAGVIETLVALDQKDQAKQLLSKWIAEPTSLGLFRNYMASVQAKYGKDGLNEASKQFSQWLKEGVVSGDEAEYMNAQTLFLSGDKEEAKSSLQRLSKSNTVTKRTDYWLLVATMAESDDDKDTALSAFRNWQSLSPSDPMPVMGEVRILAERGDYKQAIDVLDKTLPDFEEPAPGMILKAQLLMKMGQFPSMKRELEKLPIEMRNSDLVKALDGVAVANEGDYPRAVSQIAPFVEKTGNEDLFRWLMYAISRKGDEAEKKAALERQLEMKPQSGLANFLMGNHKAESGDFSAAITFYKTATETGAINPLLFNNYAYSLMEVGELESAVPYAVRAIDISPNPAYLDTLVEIYIKMGKKEDAAQAIERYKNAGGEVTDKVVELESKI